MNSSSDAVRTRVRSAAAAAGISLTNISIRSGHSPSWLAVKLGRSALSDDDLRQISGVLGKSSDWLRTGRGPEAGAITTRIETGPRDLPLYRGHSIGGLATAGLTDIRELTDRPGILAGVPDGFAIRIADDRLRPRYRRGDILYFHPGAAPEAGDGVVVTIGAERCIGVLIAIGPQGVVLQSLQPNETATVEVGVLAREIGVARR